MVLFRALIDQSNDAIEVVDPITGRYLDVNESACQRLGYTRQEMLSMNVSDVEIIAVSPSSMPAIAEEIRPIWIQNSRGPASPERRFNVSRRGQRPAHSTQPQLPGRGGSR